MSANHLHELDKYLCGQVITNLRLAVREWRLPSALDGLSPALKTVTLGSLSSPPPPVPAPELLLNDEELWEIINVVEAKLDDARWLPASRHYQQAALCTGQIRRRLAPSEAEAWAAVANSFRAELDSGSLSLAEGVDVIREWVRVIRRYLEAMDHLDLVPRPDGAYPTPSRPAPGRVAVAAPPEEQYVPRMRCAIAQHTDGSKASADDLVKLAGVKRDLGRKALRLLEQQGEYAGFCDKRFKCSPK